MSLDPTIQLFQKSKTMEDMSYISRTMSLSLALATDKECRKLILETQRQSWIRPMLRIAELDNLETLKRRLKDSTESFAKLEELGRIGTLEALELAEEFALDELKMLDMIVINRAFLAQYLRGENMSVGLTRPELFGIHNLKWIKSLGWMRTSTAIKCLDSAPERVSVLVRKHPWWIWILENGREDMINPVHFTEEQRSSD